MHTPNVRGFNFRQETRMTCFVLVPIGRYEIIVAAQPIASEVYVIRHRLQTVLSAEGRTLVSILYLGTGEAFDHTQPNVSFVLTSSSQRVLFDCGYSIPHQLWNISTDPNYIHSIYLSHFHADHCFGLPAVIARLGQDGRTAPLAIIGGPGSQQAATAVLELGYPGILKKIGFPLRFLEIAPGAPETYGGWMFSTALSLHSSPNYSVRVDTGKGTVCYSGDGAASASSELLYRDADLLVHEMYHLDSHPKRSHASVPEVVEMAKLMGVRVLHGVHLSRVHSPPVGVTIPDLGRVYRFPFD